MKISFQNSIFFLSYSQETKIDFLCGASWSWIKEDSRHLAWSYTKLPKQHLEPNIVQCFLLEIMAFMYLRILCNLVKDWIWIWTKVNRFTISKIPKLDIKIAHKKEHKLVGEMEWIVGGMKPEVFSANWHYRAGWVWIPSFLCITALHE